MRTKRKSERSLAALVKATPEGRDRYVDLVRAFSILVVVAGHWLMAIVHLDGDGFSGANVLDVVPGLWLLTWVLQVMPLFFLVGGFSNLVAWRSIESKQLTYGDFLRSRVARLMRPTLVFIGIWTVIALVIRLTLPDVSRQIGAATELLAKPLWFLAVYVLVVALSPMMLTLHRRFGIGVLAFLVGSAVVVDVLRVGFGIPLVGYLNFAFVWLFAHQLGFFYADGSLTALSKRFFTALGLAALATLGLLTSSGIYSPSMVGMQSEAVSNNSPPSICLVVLTVWLTSAAMLVRPAALRWLQHRRTWTAVVAANSMIMTIFLWHLTAVMVCVLVLVPLGFPQPNGGSALWWAWRPVWLIALSLVLAGFVAVFARFERPTSDRGKELRSGARPIVVAGVAALVAGLGGLAQFGFAMEPVSGTAGVLPLALLNSLLVLAGYRTLALRARRTEVEHA
jgi:hypothetical protein